MLKAGWHTARNAHGAHPILHQTRVASPCMAHSLHTTCQHSPHGTRPCMQHHMSACAATPPVPHPPCRCDCPKDRDGPDCSEMASQRTLARRCSKLMYKDTTECLTAKQACMNDCNQRGECVAGFCKCTAGARAWQLCRSPLSGLSHACLQLPTEHSGHNMD